MNQEDAKNEIIKEWCSLPKELRQTDEQAAQFAMQIKDKARPPRWQRWFAPAQQHP